MGSSCQDTQIKKMAAISTLGLGLDSMAVSVYAKLC